MLNRRNSRRAVPTGAALLLLCTLGCATTPPGRQQAGPPSSLPPLAASKTAGTDISAGTSAALLFFDADRLGSAQVTANHAEDALVSRCLDKLGMTYQPPTFQAPLNPLVPALDVAQAAVDGYDAGTTQPGASPAPTPGAAYTRAVNGDLQDAVSFTLPYGTFTVSLSGKGCLAEARGTLYGSLQNAARVLFEEQFIANDIVARSQTEPDVVQARAAWSTCMHAAGLSYGSPNEAQAGAAQDPAHAVAIATADATCRQTTGYVHAVVTGELATFTGSPAAEQAEMSAVADLLVKAAG